MAVWYIHRVTGEVDAELKAVVQKPVNVVVAKMAKLRVADAISEVFHCSAVAINILMRQLLGYSEKMRFSTLETMSLLQARRFLSSLVTDM